jgi:hypothetical protein
MSEPRVDVQGRRTARSTRAVVDIACGMVGGLVACFLMDQITTSWAHRLVPDRPTGALIGTFALFAACVAASWKRPQAGLAAGISTVALLGVGQVLWDPSYLDIDPWTLDPVALVAYCAQQPLMAACASLLITVSVLTLSSRR